MKPFITQISEVLYYVAAPEKPEGYLTHEEWIEKYHKPKNLALYNKIPIAEESRELAEDAICKSHFDGNLMWSIKENELYPLDESVSVEKKQMMFSSSLNGWVEINREDLTPRDRLELRLKEVAILKLKQ